MPLSPADVQYLNQLLDRRLKARRSWPWARYVLLGFGALYILMAWWGIRTANKLTQMAFSPDSSFYLGATKTSAATRAQTQPVTRSSMDAAVLLGESDARLASLMATIGLATFVCSMFALCLGLAFLLVPLFRWNIHRQERILITLLREKCAAELTPPPA